MLPILIDPNLVAIGIAGSGEGLRRKLDLLAEAGVAPAAVFDGQLPGREALAGLRILFVAGLDDATSQAVAQPARAAGILVNVEDRPALSDFHVPARLRRGDLLFTVSTGGKSPALTRALREELERLFGPEWGGRIEEVAKLRDGWRAAGVAPGDVSRRTRAHMDEKGWLA